MKLKDVSSLGEKLRPPRQHIKKQRHYFAYKGPFSQSYDFFSSHVWMWELGNKKGWVSENWCLWTVVQKRLLRVLWTARRVNQSILKKINPEYSLEGLMLKLQYSGHLMWRANSFEKTDAGKDWRQQKRQMTEDEMVGWHHQLNGHDESEQIPMVKDREASCPAVHRVEKSQTRLSKWTTTTMRNTQVTLYLTLQGWTLLKLGRGIKVSTHIKHWSQLMQ